MNKQVPDDADIEALDVRALMARLARTDWENDPLFVPDELVFRPFGRARKAKDEARVAAIALNRDLGDALLGQWSICTDSLEVLANEPKHPAIVLNYFPVRNWGDGQRTQVNMISSGK